MRVAVVGAGAIGGVVAWFLAKAGLKPTIVARGATASLIADEGLTLISSSGEATVAVATATDPAALGPQDLVLVGFKAHDWPGGLGLVRPLIGAGTVVVPLLNGIPWWYLEGLDPKFGNRRLASVDPDGAIAAAIPASRIIGGVVYVGANRPAPNRIDWNGRKRLILGEPSGEMSGRLADIVAFLKSAEIDAEATADIRAAVWQKLYGNACFNPISALTGATIDAIVGDPAVKAVARAIIAECQAVAGAVGIGEKIDIDQRLVLPPTMIGVKTSMLQDMEAGRPLELGAIVEAVAELGRRTGVPTPILEATGALAANAWRQRWGG
jgi:2-dehydropantoate 2-reductase